MGNIALKWMGERSRLFICRDADGNVVSSGDWQSGDGDRDKWQAFKATKPVDLLLMSLASCSAYEVVNILERQRQDLTDLYVNVVSKQQPEPPYAFTEIHLQFQLEGDALDEAKVQRAIELSVDKYCTVAATLRGNVAITHAFEIKPSVP